MNLIILKKYDCLKYFNYNLLKKSKVLSLDSKVSYILKKKNINIMECEDILPEDKCYKVIKNFDLNFIPVIKLFNKKLFSIDKFFKKKKWPLFNNIFLDFKQKTGYLLYLNLIINILYKKYNLKKVYFVSSISPFENNFDNSNFESIDYIFANNEKLKKLKKNIIKKKIEKNFKIKKKYSFFNEIKNKIKKLLFYFKVFNKNILILDTKLNSDLKNSFDKNKLKLISCNFRDSHNDNQNNLINNKNFFKNENKKLYIFDNLNLKKILNNYFNNYLKFLPYFIKNYNYYCNRLKNTKMVVFRYSGFPELKSILFKKICDDLKIFNLIWFHGPTGWYKKSLGGYNYSDLFLFNKIGFTGMKPKIKTNLNNKKISFFHLGYLNNIVVNKRKNNRKKKNFNCCRI